MIAIEQIARHRPVITRVLAAVAALLVLCHIGWQLVKHWTGHDYVFGLIKLFHLDEEWNVPATFSALLLLSAATLLVIVTLHEKYKGSRDAVRWGVLAAGFLYMAIDEFGHLHEQLIRPGRALLGDRSLGIFYYAWVIPAAAVVAIVALYFIGFLRRLPARTRIAFCAAALLFVGGALGFEMLEGRHDELYGERNLTYMVYVIIEETLEMAGVIVFIDALLRYIAEHGIGLPRLPQATTAEPILPAQHPRRDS